MGVCECVCSARALSVCGGNGSGVATILAKPQVDIDFMYNADGSFVRDKALGV